MYIKCDFCKKKKPNNKTGAKVENTLIRNSQFL